jgi:hypothetical protein
MLHGYRLMQPAVVCIAHTSIINALCSWSELMASRLGVAVRGKVSCAVQYCVTGWDRSDLDNHRTCRWKHSKIAGNSAGSRRLMSMQSCIVGEKGTCASVLRYLTIHQVKCSVSTVHPLSFDYRPVFPGPLGCCLPRRSCRFGNKAAAGGLFRICGSPAPALR